MERYLVGDHEDGLLRDVVLAPPTCCSCSCCSCTMGVPEVVSAHRALVAFDDIAVGAQEFPDLADAQAVLLGGLARGNLLALPLFVILTFLVGENVLILAVIGAVILLGGTVFLSVRIGLEYGLEGGWVSGLFLGLGNILAMVLVTAAEVYGLIGLALFSPLDALGGLLGVALAVWLMQRGRATRARLERALWSRRADEEE